MALRLVQKLQILFYALHKLPKEMHLFLLGNSVFNFFKSNI